MKTTKNKADYVYGIERLIDKFYLTRKVRNTNITKLSTDIGFDKLSHAKNFAKFFNIKIEVINK